MDKEHVIVQWEYCTLPTSKSQPITESGLNRMGDGRWEHYQTLEFNGCLVYHFKRIKALDHKEE